VVGAHTDSPVLKLKPASKRTDHGYIQVATETYGGGLWHTWFDRDLTLAGSVIVKDGKGFLQRLLHIKRPLLRIPNLCIHLQSADEKASFAVNKETHLVPILAMVDDLNRTSAENGDAEAPSVKQETDSRHAPELLGLLAKELGCSPGDILDFELFICDTLPAQLWGPKEEFHSSPRLDNQVHCFTAVEALCETDPIASDVNMIVLFDHEECGSSSLCGAGGPVFEEAMQRVSRCFLLCDIIPASSEELLAISRRKSFLISADVAHAVHPNYSGKHEKGHQPKLNAGTIIKSNTNQRYATNLVSGFAIREFGRRAKVPLQEFMVRSDCPCGTTIGPIIAERIGLRAVDIGVPSLSMHSIRETIGVADIGTNLALIKEFFSSFRLVDDACDFGRPR